MRDARGDRTRMQSAGCTSRTMRHYQGIAMTRSDGRRQLGKYDVHVHAAQQAGKQNAAPHKQVAQSLSFVCVSPSLARFLTHPNNAPY
jgi:hypothetical protein